MEKSWLDSSFYLDYHHASVVDFIKETVSVSKSKEEQAIELYYAVRDGIRYDPYTYSYDKHSFKASEVIKAKRAWCVPKAILYTTCCRSIGLCARLGFADVRNHLSTQRMRDTMKTDVFAWHGYTIVLLHGKWVKATPAFNIELCEKFKLRPLEFDGHSDSLYHSFDLAGNQHMEYLTDRGEYDDFPFNKMVSELTDIYPHTAQIQTANFDEDVDAETQRL